ncbi:type I secretion C-terminal target domain-containing protein [Rhodobacterales bacterium]|nr:type I secretion C-terminal target domain-containing protein [Rhodobacterales bacterium]
MNEFVRFAQLTDSAGGEGNSAQQDPAGSLLITRPGAGQGVVETRQPGQFVDFRQILNDDISFFRIGDDLQLVFGNGGSRVVQGFFSEDGSGTVAIVGDDRFLSTDEFSSIANVQPADDIQTAAGETSVLATALGGPQSSGQNFENVTIDSLGEGIGFNSLLEGETAGAIESFESEDAAPEVDTTPFLIPGAFSGVGIVLDEGNLGDGNEAGGGPLESSGDLGISFGENAGGSLSLRLKTSGAIPLDPDGNLILLSSDGLGMGYSLLTRPGVGQVLSGFNFRTGEILFRFEITIVAGAGINGAPGAQYSFQLSGNIDHDTAETDDSLPLTFTITATDSNGDSVDRVITFNIQDDSAELGGNADNGIVDEDGLIIGSGDVVAEGKLNIRWGADNGDNDKTADLAGERNGNVYEQDTPGGNGNRSVVFGGLEASGPTAPGGPYLPDFLTLSDNNGNVLDLASLTSRGVDLTFVLSADGTVLTAYAGANTVFVVSLSDEEGGGYLFDLQDVLDHPDVASEDEILMSFEFTATDGDGDAVSGLFSVTVGDDVPEVDGGAIEDSVVDEDGFVPDVLETGAGIPGGDGDAGEDATSVIGKSLGIDWGADSENSAVNGGIDEAKGAVEGDRSVVFADTVVSTLEAQGLSSNGIDLVYEISSNGTVLTATAGEGGPTVFVVQLSDEGAGSYSVDLLRNLDHVVAGTEDDIALNFDFVATDSDGDFVTDSFQVIVDDDSAEISLATITSSTVDEDGLSPAVAGNLISPQGPGDAPGLATDISHAQTTLGIDWGADNANASVDGGIDTATGPADGDRSVVFAADIVTSLQAQALSSNGATLTYALDATRTTLTATAGADGPVVFVVNLSDQDAGSYSFDLQGNLDHPDSTSEDDIVLNFDFVATDSDGDPAEGAFTVTVDDDSPFAIGPIADGHVEEEQLTGGNEDTSGGDPDLIGTTDNDFEVNLPFVGKVFTDLTDETASASLNILWGSDRGNSDANGGGFTGTQVEGDRSVIFSDFSDAAANIQVASDSATNLALTSNGVAVQYELLANNTVLNAFVVDGGVKSDVFTVTLSDTDAGEYNFELKGTLDHPVGGGENELYLTFDFTARDSDGDASSSSFEVHVIDDKPLVSNALNIVSDEDDINTGDALGTSPGLPDPDKTQPVVETPFDIPDGLGDAATVIGSLSDVVTFGADGPAATGGYAFTGDAVTFMTSLGLTSAGAAISYEISGDTLLAYFDNVGNPGYEPVIDFPIFLFKLDPDSGDFVFQQIGQLDHAPGDGENSQLQSTGGPIDAIDFGRIIVASDADGDSLNLDGKLNISIKDDIPRPAATLEGEIRIDETGGSNGDNSSDPTLADLFLSVTGGSDADFGSPIYAQKDIVDGNSGYFGNGADFYEPTSSFDLQIDTANPDSGLETTSGDKIILVLQSDGIVVGVIDAPGEANDGKAAFAIHMRNEFGDISGSDLNEVTVVQYVSVRHADGTPGGDTVDLAGKVYAVLTITDYDGDTVASDRLSIGEAIKFDDGGPSAGAGETVLLDDDDLSGGNPGGVGDQAGTPTNLTGTLDHSFGPDGEGGKISWLATSTADDPALGFSFVPEADGATLLVKQGDTVVFKVDVVQSTGAYTITQLAPVTHADGGDENDVTFELRYEVKDGDGDTAEGSLTVSVDDDTPELGTASIADGVDEDGFISAATVSTSGSLDVKWGADNGDARSVAFAEVAAGQYVSFSDPVSALAGVTSNGTAVAFAFVGDVLVGYTIDAAAPDTLAASNIVLTVTLSDTGNGGYDFELRQPLDHTAPSGTEHYLDLTFGFNATDSDNDVSGDGAFTIRVDAAGTISSIDYSALTSGVFVNLGAADVTYGGQTVAGETATDRDGATPAVIGQDKVTGIIDAYGGSGADVLVGQNGEANILGGNGGDDVFILGRDANAGAGQTRQVTLGDGSTSDVSIAGRAETSDTVLGGADFDTVVLESGNGSDGFVLDASQSATVQNIEEIEGTGGDDVVILDSAYVSDEADGGVQISGLGGDDVIQSGAGDDTLSGGGGNDLLSGLAGNDVLKGGTGADELHGGSGKDKLRGGGDDDRLIGGADDDSLRGDEGVDTAAFADVLDTTNVQLDGTDGWIVTTSSEGTDTLETVEIVEHGGGRILLVGNGGFATIQNAIDAALDGDTILIAPGTYQENLTIDKGVSLVAAGAVAVEATAGNAVSILPGVDGFDISFSGINLVGNGTGDTGIDVAAGANVGTLSFSDGFISSFTNRGIYATDGGNPTGTPAMGDLVVSDVIFTDIGDGGGNTAHIKLFGYDGDATFKNVTIDGGSDVDVSAWPDNAIEITGGLNGAGNANPVPANEPDIGTVVFDGVVVVGAFEKNPVGIFNFNQIDGLSIPGLILTGAESDWGPLFNIDGVADDVIDASGFTISFPSGGDIVTEIQGDKTGQGPVDQTLTGTDYNDRIIGKEGNDELFGGDGNDELYGADKPGGAAEFEVGNDILRGGKGNDFADGGAGDDMIYGGGGRDELHGGEGNDLVEGGGGRDALYGDAGNDELSGGGGRDELYGDEGDDELSGDRGHDQLYGGEGDDDLEGGAGNDRIDGGEDASGGDIDTAHYSNSLDVDAFTDNGGNWTVSAGTEGTDTVTNVEVVEHAGGRILLVGNGGFDTIQEAVDAAQSGDTILVAAGTYDEDVVIDKPLTLLSAGGAGTTIINGQNGELGAITIAPDAGAVTIGDTGHGFTVQGNNGSASSENAAIYLTGDQNGIIVRGNVIEARGDAGMMSEYAATVSNVTIDGNTFSGQTFIGSEPAGNGFSEQFTLDNVPRQLVVIGGDGQNTTNVTFTYNVVSGTVGGTNAGGEQGNTLVTIDAANSVIDGNTFSGFTNRYATAIRAREANTDITYNTFDHTSGGNSRGGLVVNDGTPGTYSGNVLTGGDGDELIYGITPGDDLITTGAGDDTIGWTVGSGRDTIQGATDATAAADTDTFTVTGSGENTERFLIETRAVYEAGPGATPLAAGTEVVVSRSDDNGATFTVIAELENIDDIIIDLISASPTSAGGNVTVSGDFSGTDLDAATIVVLGTSGDDTVNVEAFTGSIDGSAQKVLFITNGGDDVIEGARAADVVDVTGKTVADLAPASGGGYVVTFNEGGSVTFTGGVPAFVENAGTPSETPVNLPPLLDVPLENSGSVVESGDIVGDAPTATGDLAAIDLDGTQLTWSIEGTPSTSYGSFAIDPDGTWTYTLDDDLADPLAKDESATESFVAKVTDADGASRLVTVEVTVNGSNDSPVISVETGDSSSDGLTETDSGLTTSGTLTVADVDLSDAVSASVLSVSASGSGIDGLFTPTALLGFFSLGSNPVVAGGAAQGSIAWAFNSNGEAFDFLPEGDQSVISYTIEVDDGNGGTATQVVQITLTGTNDAAEITGEVSGAATEDVAVDLSGNLVASGQLDVTDVDGDNSFDTSVTFKQASHGDGSARGSLSITAGGDWTYSVANGSAGVQGLSTGESFTETFTVTSADGTEQDVTITVSGSNDEAVISGEVSGAVKEDVAVDLSGNLVASGQLSVTDVDGDNSFDTSVTFKQASHGDGTARGSLSITADGDWTYSVANGSAGVQGLSTGESFTETFTVTSADGTEQDVTITVNGADEPAAPTTTTIDFDDDSLKGGGRVPDGYGGLNWSAEGSPTASSNSKAIDVFVKNNEDIAINKSAAKFVYITAPDGDSFDFKGAEFVSLGSANELKVSGYKDGVLVGSFDVTLTGTLTFSGTDINGIDELVFEVTSGTESGKGIANTGDYGFDNLQIVHHAGTDPIALDLNGDGVDLSAQVSFDIDADGEAEQIGWVGSEDALLVMDSDGSGAIENGSEVFSEVFAGGSYADSLEALASLDVNGDGIIDIRDAAFADIKVWQDANSDGFAQEGELLSLTDRGIDSIDLDAAAVNDTVDGNTVFAEGSYTFADGSKGTYVGVSFGAANDDPDGEDATRQSVAMAAAAALVLYTASTEEVAAGLVDITVKTAPAHGEIAISDDMTVTYMLPSGYEGQDGVELGLVFADGSVVTRDITVEVLADEPEVPTTASVTETGTEVADQSGSDDTDMHDAPATGDSSEVTVKVTASVISGDDGDNILVGTDGDDILAGGLGSDILTGGEGADTFILSDLTDADVITDYSFDQGDRIDLGQLLDGAFGPGVDASEFVRASKGDDGNVHLEVDMDGAGAGHDWQEAAIMTDHASMGDTIRVVMDSDGSEVQVAVHAA